MGGGGEGVNQTNCITRRLFSSHLSAYHGIFNIQYFDKIAISLDHINQETAGEVFFDLQLLSFSSFF